MNLPENGSPFAKLASILGRSRPHQEKVVDASSRSKPCQYSLPAPLEIEWDETTVSLLHLDQHIGFDNDESNLEIHAINELVEHICSTNDGANLSDAQSSWLRLYSAHDTVAAPAEAQDVHRVPQEADIVDQAGDKCGSESTTCDSDALAHETSAAANEVDTASVDLEADVTEIQASSFEEAADASDTKDSSMEANGTESKTNFGFAERWTGEAGLCATPTGEAPTPKPTTPTTNDENVVELADFDPERDVIGVFYAKSIDAVTGKSITPKVRVSDNSDGPGHIISLDGFEVARVIGAKNLTEHQVKLIAE